MVTKRVKKGKVYLIHFEQSLHHAGHYLGFTTDLVNRLNQHDEGIGAKIMAAIAELGIEWRLAAVWDDLAIPSAGRNGWTYASPLEAKFKRGKNNRVLCPICRKKG